MENACTSNLGHRLLYGLDEYFNAERELPANFFRTIAFSSDLEHEFTKAAREHSVCVKIILEFLKAGGKINVAPVRRNGDEIDCGRFGLNVLRVLGKAGVENQNVIEHDEFWEVYAKVATRVFEQFDKEPSRTVKFNSLLDPLMDKFRKTTSWKLRANILKGFKSIAWHIPKRGPIFWEYCMCFLSHYEAACRCYPRKGSLPKPVEDGITYVIDLWRMLATRYKSDKTVQRQVVSMALRLLNLIDMAEIQLSKGLMALNDSLVAFEFNTIDYIVGGPLLRPRRIQSKLESAAYKLIDFINRTSPCAPVLDTLDTLLPYLWGSKNPRDRRVPASQYSKGNVRFAQLCSFAARIKDICALSYRGFNIIVEGMSLRQDYISDKYYRGERINGIPCRQICFSYPGSKQFVSAKKVHLEIPFGKKGQEEARLVMPCAIHRAARLGDNDASLIVWTPKEFKPSVPTAWRNYVRSLESPRSSPRV